MIPTAARLGLRNLRRRRGRTFLTVLMLTGGTTLTVWAVGLAEGTYSQMIDLSTRTYTGHLQVVGNGYHTRPSLFRTVDDPGAVTAALRAQPGVAAVGQRVETAGLIALDNRTTGAMVVGVDPTTEGRVSTIPGWIKEGRWLDGDLPNGDLPALIGSGIARRLKAELGAEVSFVGQAADGSIAAELFRVTGIVESGADELDSGIVFVRLKDAQEVLSLGGRVHRVLAVLDDLDDLAAVTAATPRLASNDVLPWPDLLPDLASYIRQDRAGMQVFLVIILIMVLLGITNTMMMSVFERTREIGVMLALGASPGHVVAVTLWEAFFLSVMGVGLGVGFGCLLTEGVPIPLGDEPFQFMGLAFKEMVGRVGLDCAVIYPSAILTSGVAAALFPALRAARLSPSSAIRKL